MSVAKTVRSALATGVLLATSAVAANAQTPSILPFLGLGGNVSVRFVGANAGDRSILSYKIGGVFNSGTYTQLFVNKGAGVTAAGTEVNIGPVAAGTEVIFQLFNTSTNNTYYSGAAARNPDGIAHVSTSNPSASGGAAVGGGNYTTAFNFEDRFSPPSDLDYNDLNFEIAGVSQRTVTPEPSTYALMVTGLLAMGVASRRRRRV